MTESKEDPLRFIDGPEVPPATDAGTGVTSGFNPEEKPVKPPREMLLRAEKDMLINDLVRKRGKEEVKYCYNNWIDLAMCQNKSGIQYLWKCNDEWMAFRKCMQWAFYNTQLRDECKDQYVREKKESIIRNKQIAKETKIRDAVIAEWLKNN